MPVNHPDPAIGSHQQPFAGLATFMRRAPSRDLHGADAAIVGVPFDSGTSYRSGARFGPRKIREASLQLWGHNTVLGVTPTEVLQIIDYGDVEVVPVDIRQTQQLGLETIIETIRTTVGQRPVYVSLDIDAIDPAYAPGTGIPEVGGFTSYEMLRLVRGLDGLNLVGFDLVEVSPPYDHSDITSILAANLVFEFLSLLALIKRRST